MAVENLLGNNRTVSKPLQESTVTPTTSEQTVLPETGYELSKVTVEGVTSSIDSNIIPSNIKKDVTILSVTGTLESGSSTGGTYKIVAAELPDRYISVYLGDTLVESQYTPTTSGGNVEFQLTATGTYTVTAFDSSDTQLWTTDIEITDIGSYTAKVPDTTTVYAMNNYTVAELDTICQGGYASTMFDIKSKYTFTQTGSILNSYDFFIEDIEQSGDSEIIYFRSCNTYSGASYNINPYYGRLASLDATSFTNDHSSDGGYKYSYMRTRMMGAGESIYTQATGIIPDDSTLETGIKFSEFYYTDGNGGTSSVYTYTAETDSFSADTEFEIQSSYIPKYLKGYFVSVGTIDEDTFNAGYYYTYASYVYTRATTYSSSTTYYGLYETIQTDGIFLSAVSSLSPYLVRTADKSSTGRTNITYLSESNDYVDIPCVEEVTGTNRYTVLFSSRTKTSSTKGSSISSYNIAGEGDKRPAYNSFDVQACGNYYLTRSPSYTLSYSFCGIYNSGGINYSYVSGTYGVRLGFKFL